jgi:hypothetical protein
MLFANCFGLSLFSNPSLYPLTKRVFLCPPYKGDNRGFLRVRQARMSAYVSPLTWWEIIIAVGSGDPTGARRMFRYSQNNTQRTGVFVDSS